MLNFGNDRYFGIDIGESAIKLVEVKKVHEGFRIARARIAELDIDPTFEDKEKKIRVTKERLNQLLDEEGISSGVAALSISGQSVFIRFLKVPKIAKNKIEQIIQYEAQLQVPFPMNEVIWNYELFEAHDSPEAEVALVAVKKDIVHEKLDLIQGTGLEVEFIEVDSFALFNALDFVGGVKNKIILDMGSAATDIIIVEENKIWTRTILTGGDDLTKAIAASMNISFKEAEKLKRKEGIILLSDQEKDYSPHAAVISDAIAPVLVDLQTDISKSIGYYKSQFDKTKIFREVLVTGGCTKLKNIVEYISGNIDIPAKRFDLLEKIKSDLDFDITKDITGRVSVAFGLALRTVTPLFTSTNLVPKEMQKAKEFEHKKWYIAGSLCVAILIFATLTLFVNWSNKEGEAALTKAQSTIDHYNDFHIEISRKQSQVRGIKRRMDFIAEMSEEKKKAIEIYTELAKALPDDVWLTRIEQDKDRLTVGGRVKGSFERITAFKKALSRSGYFKRIRVESANVLDGDDITEDIRAFTIIIEI